MQVKFGWPFLLIATWKTGLKRNNPPVYPSFWGCGITFLTVGVSGEFITENLKQTMEKNFSAWLCQTASLLQTLCLRGRMSSISW